MNVAIVGGGPGAVGAPFDDDAWECWGFNTVYRDLPFGRVRWTRWFEMHLIGEWERCYPAHMAVLATLRASRPPVLYMQETSPRYPAALRYPREDVEALCPTGGWHACSVDWMVAFAVHVGVSRIRLCGIGADPDIGQPMSAKGCIEHWLGFAMGRGIGVEWEPESGLFQNYSIHATTRPYGYEFIQERDGFVVEKGDT